MTVSSNVSFNKIDAIVVKSGNTFMYATPDADLYTTVDVHEDNMFINEYNSTWNLVQSKELPIFGTFYAGENYNYIAYGKKNKEQANKEVIRIVKYDKNFNRIDAASIYGDEIVTVIPFDTATGRMSESNGKLVFHISRERYVASDVFYPLMNVL